MARENKSTTRSRLTVVVQRGSGVFLRSEHGDEFQESHRGGSRNSGDRSGRPQRALCASSGRVDAAIKGRIAASSRCPPWTVPATREARFACLTARRAKISRATGSLHRAAPTCGFREDDKAPPPREVPEPPAQFRLRSVLPFPSPPPSPHLIGCLDCTSTEALASHNEEARLARLHEVGSWHGPGEERAARLLAELLPAEWDVVAGRDVPDGIGTVDIDLVVVGEGGVYVCEEKAWGRRIEVDEVAWYVDGQRRHSPNNQVQHATRVLAGRVKERLRGWRTVAKNFSREKPAFRGHVLLSNSRAEVHGAALLGPDVVLSLRDAPRVLIRIDAEADRALMPLRPRIVEYLIGQRPRQSRWVPPAIHHYTVLDAPIASENALLYPAQNPAGDFFSLQCVPVASSRDPASAHLLAIREHAALAALSRKERTWGVQDWFPWDGYIVTPIRVDLDGVSLARRDRAPSPAEACDATKELFLALADVHAEGITHRALQPRSIEFDPRGRVRFRDFSRSRLPSTETISPFLDDEHPSAGYRPVGVPLAAHEPADDVYALAKIVLEWLSTFSTDTAIRQGNFASVRALLQQCTHSNRSDRPSARAAAEELATAALLFHASSLDPQG